VVSRWVSEFRADQHARAEDEGGDEHRGHTAQDERGDPVRSV